MRSGCSGMLFRCTSQAMADWRSSACLCWDVFWMTLVVRTHPHRQGLQLLETIVGLSGQKFFQSLGPFQAGLGPLRLVFEQMHRSALEFRACRSQAPCC